MKTTSKFHNYERTLLTALLVALSIHASASECNSKKYKETCTITCDEGFIRNHESYCRYQLYDVTEKYKVDIIFKFNFEYFGMEFMDLNNWENQFHETFEYSELNSVSLRSNQLSVTPLIRTPTQLYIKHFDLSDNLMKEFNLRSLHYVQNLESFNLSHNHISYLKGSTYEPNKHFIKTLSVLDLSYNLIGRIQESTFSSLKSLTSLDLSHNNISYIGILCFGGLDSLYSLNLSFNNLKWFNMGLFNLRKLEFLDVSFNYLTTLHRYFLPLLSVHLKQLNIQNNNIKSLDPQVFSSHTSLERLNMSHNDLSDSLNESLFQNNVYLVSVDLSFNGMSSLVPNAFSSQNLAIFKVTGNRFSGALVPGYFNGMGRVTTLDLSHQYLTGVSNYTFALANGLEILNLSYNMIFFIENKAFFWLFNLTSIDLSHNRITVIHLDDSDLVSLRSFRINHNLVTMINENTFENLNTLEELDISHNKIVNFCAKCLHLRSLRHLRYTTDYVFNTKISGQTLINVYYF